MFPKLLNLSGRVCDGALAAILLHVEVHEALPR
jgi:hypothetical protein